MAIYPIPTITDPDPFHAQRLTREEWWDPFDHLRLSQQPDYVEYGGPIAFLRKERGAD
jgi:hypothetical protein